MKKKLLFCFSFSFSFILFLLPVISVFATEEASDSNIEKVIYLTFDDGPSTNSSKILDILKKEEVPGTFFLMGKLIDGKEDIVKRIYDENHAIGLHSFTHERSKVYSSKETFLKEMLKTQAAIEKVTGEKSYIIRFPFGANNDSFKLKESWVTVLHENNLKLYDWTVDSNDGMDVHSPPAILLKNSKSKNPEITLLMHCTEANNNTVKALPSIIKYYKDNGYTFKKITPETKEIYKIFKQK
ncbi:MAG: polysaccharide deacetylase family protein [Sarcina sp.]